MDRRRPAVCSLAAVAIVVLLAVTALPATAQSSGTLLSTVPGPIDPGGVLITVTVGQQGDATWQVRYTFALDDANATAAFESLEADVEADPGTYRDRFGDRMRETAATAETATGREMAIENVSVDASIDLFTGDQGFVTYRFAWTSFAASDGPRLVVGDAIDGLFLTPNASLTVAWPQGYAATEVHPGPDEQRPTAVTWPGERNFGPGEPRVVLAPESGAPANAGGGGTTAPAGGGSGPVSVPVAVLALAAVGAVTVVGAAWRWRERLGNALRGAMTGDRSADEDPADELLTNEERVLSILEQHGGRAKQQDVVAATGWSEVKTSEVVQELREEGTIEAFRLGRENVLSLPDDART